MYSPVKSMRRLIYLLLLVSFVGISATCVNASTDCERWFVAYRRELAHTRSLQQIAAAKRRARLYAQRKLNVVTQPKPKPHLVLAKGPRMTRKQTLHHFELACGVLPEDESDKSVISEETPAPYHHARSSGPQDSVDLMPAAVEETIAENDPPPTPTGFTTYSPPGGTPLAYPPFTNGPPSPQSSNPPDNPPPPDNSPPVPEPTSYVLMLTGLAGVAGAVRSRLNR